LALDVGGGIGKTLLSELFLHVNEQAAYSLALVECSHTQLKEILYRVFSKKLSLTVISQSSGLPFR
jgi:hypothetical protein